MNIFNKVALESLKKSKTQTLVTIIGVVLSSAMITAVTTFGVSLLDYMQRGAELKYGDWHVEFADVTKDFATEQAQNDKLEDVFTVRNLGYATLEGSANPDKPYLFLVGFDENAQNSLPLNIVTGRFPENENEILISSKVASNGGVTYHVGDIIRLEIGDRILDGKQLSQHDAFTSGEKLSLYTDRYFTVVGIYQRPSFEEYTAPGYTAITRDSTAYCGDSYSLFVKLANPFGLHKYLEQIKTKGYLPNDHVLRFLGLSDDTLFTTLLYSLAVVVIAIIMTGSIFLIYNAFSISLSERVRQFGILASVGATSKQLKKSVLFEGLCIGIVAIPIGVIIGLFSIWGILFIVAKSFSNVMYIGVSLTLKISPLAILIAAAFSFITIEISAYIPARKAAHTPIMECIRQSNEVKLDGKDVKLNKLQAKIYKFEGTLALKNFKRNKKRYSSIVLSLVLSVVLFVSTGSFVSYLKQFGNMTLEFTDTDITMAIKGADDKVLTDTYEALKGTEFVTRSYYQAYYVSHCDIAKSDLNPDFLQELAKEENSQSPDASQELAKEENSQSSDASQELALGLQFLADSTYLQILRDSGLSTDDYYEKLLAVAKEDPANAIYKLPACTQFDDTDTSTDDGIHVNEMFLSNPASIPLTVGTSCDTRTAELQFIDIVPPDVPISEEGYEKTSYFFRIMAPYSLKATLLSDITLPADGMGIAFNSDNPSQTAKQMDEILQGIGLTQEYTLYNTHQFMEENRNTIFITNVFAYTFILMISLIAIANVFNTISTNIKLRRRELAMLRSVGMSDADFQKMMNFECAFYGIRTLLFGLPAAIVISVIIYYLMVLSGAPELYFVFPFRDLFISIVGVLLAIFITMLYAIHEIKRENIIDALRDELG